MTRKMTAAVAHEFKKPLRLEEVPIPEVGEGRILVKIEACGVCHTDLHAVRGDWPVKPRLPLIPGHEGVGTVAAVGRGVSAVREGDRVGVPWLHTADGTCKHCLGGWETLCEKQQNTGYSVNGGFAEYVLADPKYVGLVPDGLASAPAAPILCAGVTVYKGLKETDAKAGDTVVISGIGGLGHLAVQYAVAMGMHVVAVDVHETKLALARSLGAEHTIDATRTDPVKAVQALGGAAGVLVTAVVGTAFAQGFGMLGRGGTMVLVGLPNESFPLPIFDTVLSRKTVRGSIVGTREDLRESLEYAAEGKVKAHITLDKLEKINAIFDRMLGEQIDGRVVVTM